MNWRRILAWRPAAWGDELTPAEVALRQRLGVASGPAWPTRTTVDVGHWLGNARVCAAWAGTEWVLFAAGARPFAERLPVAAVAESWYNHVTGELVLAPAPACAVRQLRLPPVAGRELLRAIQGKGD